MSSDEQKTKKYIVAVSGGIDSVVLLDMLAMQPDLDIVVAHFDHGIREDSHEDALFVEALARKYELPFESERQDLGPSASEDTARQARYSFLRQVAKKHGGRIATAHHSGDIIETIAINHSRGTGWRGLAVHDSDVLRPLSNVSKAMITEYALRRGLEWREDSTNASNAYLRNRLRRRIATLPQKTKQKLIDLRKKQVHIKKQIDQETAKLVGKGPYSRYFFTHASKQASMEVLRYVTAARLTRPQLERALLAIKTYQPAATYQAGNGIELSFTSRQFDVKLVK